MNTFPDTFDEEQHFHIGRSDLSFCRDKPFKFNGGGIILCTSGRARISIDLHEWDFSDRQEVLLFTKPTLLLKSASPDFSARVLLCSDDVMHIACHKLGSSFFDRISVAPLFTHSEESLRLTSSYLDIMELSDEDTNNDFRTIILSSLLRCLLLNISYRIRRDAGVRTPSISQNRHEQLFDSFMDILSRHVVHHRDVAYYAGKMCISPRYLTSVCRNIAGKSPKEIIDDKAIGEIKILLIYSDMTLQQIADTLHFPDQSYFGRYFKARAGINPAAFRNSRP